ncbi:glycosyltransferase family 4 protein [Halobacterium salinarum]|uniref:glycosyltransferase family 4 protein n=1 Tax=Halobacterium salinarum TaxID=2242 RepID=UPI002555E76B|nr:glycosyltransferase family 4 protein [Halobacterium salinarum]MDL0130993.1 glycosyltransferase family 4 protein [Halobacterium salinarum]
MAVSKKEMKILTVVSDLHSGGVQRSAHSFVQGFRDRGHDTAVLLEEAGGEYVSKMREQGVQIFVTGADDARHQAVRFQPDAIHVHSHNVSTSLVRFLDEKLQQATIVEHVVWDKPSPYHNQIDVSCLMSKFGLWRFETSAQQRQRNSTKVLVPNPIRTNNFYPATKNETQSFRSQWNIPEDALVLGRVGQSYSGKWSLLILSTFYEVAKEYSNAHLLLRGAPEGIVEAIDVLPERIQSRVIQLPFLDEDQLRRCYSAMDIFVHAAKQGETFGNVLVESMLCETPIVTLSTPYNDNAQVEVVGQNIGGIVATTEAQFISATERLCASSELRDQLGIQGRHRAQTYFGAESSVEKVLNCFSEDIESTLSVSTSEIISLLENTAGGTTFWQRLLLKTRCHNEFLTKGILDLDGSGWGRLMRMTIGHDVHLQECENVDTIQDLKV